MQTSDPPPIYHTLYTPPPSRPSTGSPRTEDEQALQGFTHALIQYTTTFYAVRHSIERCYQAIAVDAVEYEILQADAVITYAQQSLEHLTTLQQHLPMFHRVVQSRVNANQVFTLSPAIIQHAQQQLQAQGLPPAIQQHLRQEGINDTDLNAFQQHLATIPLDASIPDLDTMFQAVQTAFHQTENGLKTVITTFTQRKHKALARSLPEPLPPRPRCDACQGPLTWMNPYQRWYCFTCNEYR
jgi:hypothetical protein